jgi:hypothetical protein
LPSPKVISPKRFQDVYRNEPHSEKTKQAPIAEERTVVPKMNSRGFWSTIERKHLGYFIFLCGIAMAYIANGHFAEKQIRRRDTLLKEVKEKKTLYHIADASLSMARKQSHISQDVDSLGLKKLIRPPYKLTKAKDE